MTVEPEAKRGLRLHRTSAIVLVVGLLLTGGAVLGVHLSIQRSRTRYLSSQVRSVASSIVASVPSLQDPLIAAAGLGASFGPDVFRRYVHPLVGRGDPFASASLWEVHGGAATLLAAVGVRPRLPRGVTTFDGLLQVVRAGPQLQVAGLVPGATPTLAVAERDGAGATRVVYAETRMPSMAALLAAGGATGVRYVATIEPLRAAPGVLEATAPRAPSTGTATATARLGTARLIVIGELVAAPPGSLPASLPPVLLLSGLALSGAAAAVTERQLRRRERAERLADDRDRRYEEQRGIATALQHSMRPAEPLAPDGVELAARYLPGTADLEVGGDWYDVTPLDDGSLFLSVGDVSGHGLIAATVVPSLRHTIKAYALQGDDPAVVLQRLRSLVDVERDHCLATVLCAKLDVAARRVTIGLAGHPPPLLFQGGEASFADATATTPIGVATIAPAGSTTYYLPAGTAMLLYTDGLIEQRGRTLDAGMEALRRAAQRSRGTVEQILDQLVDAAVTPRGVDDVAALVVRFPAPAHDATPVTSPVADAAVGAPSFRSFAPSPASLRGVRQFVAERLGACSGELVAVGLLVASELATNAVAHTGAPFVLGVAADPCGRWARIEVTDVGDGVPRPRDAAPSDARGRGLRLVETLSEAWGVEWGPSGATKTVWARVLDPEDVASRLRAGV